MSSAGVTVTIPQSYFCYQCNRAVTLTPSPNSDLSCPNCSGGFLEEFDGSDHTVFQPSDLFSSLLFGGSDPRHSPIIITSSTFGNPRNFSPFSTTSRSSDEFNPLTFLQSYLNSRGSNFQVILENHPSDSHPLPSNIGDYFLGPGLEQLIQQLAENDPNRYGTPPASKHAIDGLPDTVISDEIMNSDFNSCAVCMNEFDFNSTAKQMPCKHLYHSDCLLPWLQLHNSCPVCRFELPTDDPDYENTKARAGQPGNGDGASQGGASAGGGGGRRFSISLPWSLFGGFGGNSDRNNSGSSSGAQQGESDGGSGGSHPNEESLD